MKEKKSNLHMMFQYDRDQSLWSCAVIFHMNPYGKKLMFILYIDSAIISIFWSDIVELNIYVNIISDDDCEQNKIQKIDLTITMSIFTNKQMKLE